MMDSRVLTPLLPELQAIAPMRCVPEDRTPAKPDEMCGARSEQYGGRSAHLNSAAPETRATIKPYLQVQFGGRLEP